MAAVSTVLTVLFMWPLVTRTIAVQSPWKDGWRHFKRSCCSSRKTPGTDEEAEKSRGFDEGEQDTEEGDGDAKGSAEMSICARSSV